MTEQSNPFQSITTLGALRSVHGYSHFFRNNRLILSGLIVTGLFSCVSLILYGLIEDSLRAGMLVTAGLGSTLGAVAVLTFLCIFIVISFLRDWQRNERYSVGLFDGGLAIRDHQGNIQSAMWKEIETVQVIQLRHGGFRDYHAVCRDRRVMTIYHYLESAEQLGQAVVRGVNSQ